MWRIMLARYRLRGLKTAPRLFVRVRAPACKQQTFATAKNRAYSGSVLVVAHASSRRKRKPFLCWHTADVRARGRASSMEEYSTASIAFHIRQPIPANRFCKQEFKSGGGMNIESTNAA